MYLNALSTSSLSGKYICWLLKVLVHYIGLLKHGTDIIYLKKRMLLSRTLQGQSITSVHANKLDQNLRAITLLR